MTGATTIWIVDMYDARNHYRPGVSRLEVKARSKSAAITAAANRLGIHRDMVVGAYRKGGAR